MSYYDKFTALGVFIPGKNQLPGEQAFSFWAEVFGWKKPATSLKTKKERLARVLEITRAFNIHPGESGKMLLSLDRLYYNENKETCFKFFRQLQARVEARRMKWAWKTVCFDQGFIKMMEF